MRVANILSTAGAQFLWRWNNNYMLFYVPERRTKKYIEKEPVVESSKGYTKEIDVEKK